VREDMKIRKLIVPIIVVVLLIIGGVTIGVMWFSNIELYDNDYIHTDESATLAFEDLAWEMERNGGTVSIDRAIEVLGDVYDEVEGIMDSIIFAPSSRVRIQAFVRNEDVNSIWIQESPFIAKNEGLVVDEDVIRNYENNPDGLTYDYLKELIGGHAVLLNYSHGSFHFRWFLSDFDIALTVNRYGEAESLMVVNHMVFESPEAREAFIEETMDTLASIEEVQLAFDRFNILLDEMQENNGFSTRDRVIELFETVRHVTMLEDDNDGEFSLSYMICFGLWVSARGNEQGVYSIAFRDDTRFLLNSDLVIDAEVIRDYHDRWWTMPEEERPNLEYFERLLGEPGIIVGFDRLSYGTDNGEVRLTYTWISPGTTVIIWALSDGNIFALGAYNNLH
jgi:hypothetical protein